MHMAELPHILYFNQTSVNNRIISLLKDPGHIYIGVVYRFLNLFAKQLSDKAYIEWKWFVTFGRRINLDNPHTFNEKLQWLKLYNRIPDYTRLVDKYEVKKHVAALIGEQYVTPTLAVYEHAEDINFDALPNQFVLKTTHDSGGIVICTDKSKLNKEKAIKTLDKALKTDFYAYTREWPYKDVPRRIIAEQYIPTPDGDLRDYKFFCFDGVPKVMFVAADRFTPGEETTFDFFDMDFNHIDVRNGHLNSTKTILKPTGFERMKELAAKLSAGFPHVRVDFYDINGKIYFGELTFFHFSGFVKFKPHDLDIQMGRYLALPLEKHI